MFNKLIVIGAAFGALVASFVPTLPWTDLVGSSIGAGMRAWAWATVLIVLVLLFPGIALHPDFARLKMFRRYTFLLEFVSGIVLFMVAAMQLLLWPALMTGPEPLSVEALFEWIGSPIVPYQFIPEALLDILATLIGGVVVILAVLALHLHLARRLWQPNFIDALRLAFSLPWQNLRFRLTGLGTQIWPRSPTTAGAHAETEQERSELEEFMFSASFSAVSLAFGLWVPRAVSNTPNGTLASIVLVLFLAGGIHIWLRAIEVTGARGTIYVMGLWLGTALLYWPTTLVVLMMVVDVFEFMTSSFSPANVIEIQNIFMLFYRSAVGAVTILVAVGQSGQLSTRGGFPRTLRYGLATIALLVLLSFVLRALSQLPSLAPFISGLGLTIVFAGGFALFYLPNRRLHGSVVPGFAAQIITSSSIALAPLLFSKRVASVRWSEHGYADLTVKNVGIAPEPLRLRAFLAGSEDEVAFEAISNPHARMRGKLAFVLTDLRTAMQIMGAYKKRRFELRLRKKRPTYKIISVVATVPWYHVKLTEQCAHNQEELMVLDSGYLRYTPPYHEVQDTSHPCYPIRDACRPASADIVAYYAAQQQGDVYEAFLGEPFYSWFMRQPGVAANKDVRRISERRVVYVLLAREEIGTVPAVPYNWRRTICEMISEGQKAATDNKGVINHAQLHIVHSFLQQAIGPRVQLHLEDVHLALCRSSFEPRVQNDPLIAHGLLLAELAANRLLPHPEFCDLRRLLDEGGDCEAVLLQAFDKTNPLITDNDKPVQETFFQRFYNRSTDQQVTSQLQDSKDYLHRLALIPLPDHPGQLKRLLESLHSPELGAMVDLELAASANLGDSALLYLLNRFDLPDIDQLASVPTGTLLKAQNHTVNWVAKLAELGFDVVEIRAFLVTMEHQPGGLLTAVDALVDKTGGSGVNIEEVFAFPITRDIAVAVLMHKSQDWPAAFNCLMSRNFAPVPMEPPLLNRHADKVVLSRRPSFTRHSQHAVFNIKLGAGSDVSFDCMGLGTWTPTWGAIDGWCAEVRFDDVLLKIPSTLRWQIAGFGRIGRLPIFPDVVRRYLQSHLPGFAGMEAYENRHVWRLIGRIRG